MLSLTDFTRVREDELVHVAMHVDRKPSLVRVVSSVGR